MTFREAVKKKFPSLAARILHVFTLYAQEYEKTLTEEQKAQFKEIFG